MYPASSCRWRCWAGWTDGTAIQQALGPLVAQYREWIEARGPEVAAGLGQGERRDTASSCSTTRGLPPTGWHVAWRCSVRTLTCWTPSASPTGPWRARQRLGEKIGPAGPRWRPFQLAFLLLNLPGLADPHDVHRQTVDLLFFPTGGGKTEAYLGLAAVAMVLRRLRHPGDDGLAGAGVSVIMRYTLRLLTLDQLARAAGLVCALEIERTEAGRALRYVAVRDRSGWGRRRHRTSWGARGTAGRIRARAKVTAFKRNRDRNPSPIPLENCPWCCRSRKIERI